VVEHLCGCNAPPEISVVPTQPLGGVMRAHFSPPQEDKEEDRMRFDVPEMIGLIMLWIVLGVIFYTFF
jgi:hypothetical protein